MQINFDMHVMPTPAYVVDRELLTLNLQILRDVAIAAGCRILLAQKAFSMFYFYPLISQYLDGAAASGLYEARLANEYMGKQNHVFSPAYRQEDFSELTQICDHIIFNSVKQWEQFGSLARAAGVSCGLRINPQCSTQDKAIYDPCAPGSRLGIIAASLPPNIPQGIDGLHFHTLCEQNADALETTLHAVEDKFAAYLPKIKWLNMGGGHHITRSDYERERLIACVRHMRQKYGLDVFLEPGEAIALNTGFLVTTVLALTENSSITTAILDTSAACHMPDVLEMPYRPPLFNSGKAGEYAYTYRLAGPTCLAGDIIGDYSFRKALAPGDRLVFGDMAIYSMVKNNTFNGLPLPSIYSVEDNQLHKIRGFGYEDFKARLS
ncbi:MAG: carboxynorspermidine decarboxylase [Clostridiales bacterium]|nr:carboxynorspermidine decarboxylase [Clostridiales bacterium]